MAMIARAARIRSLVLLVLLGGCSLPGSAQQRLDGKKPDVKVALAAVEDQHRPLHVIIENISSAPQDHFDESNSGDTVI
jgi:hypothetical protein